jgi:hypothetical protein
MQIYLERYLQYTCENHIRNATYLLLGLTPISLRSVKYRHRL